MRTLAIGDIHGGYKALLQVLERAAVTSKDTLLFLGDYVDGWSESAQTIQFFIDLQQEQECIFLKGNHDLKLENWLQHGAIYPLEDTDKSNSPFWLAQGGESTIFSYIKTGYHKNKAHLQFLRHLKYYHIDSENRLFLHAGFTSVLGIGNENRVNYCYDRTLWEDAIAIHEIRAQGGGDELFYDPLRYKFYKEIFIGHTPTLHENENIPMNRLNVWNLDTGAAFTGKLSIMDIDTKEFWQSDPLPELYPKERGRN